MMVRSVFPLIWDVFVDVFKDKHPQQMSLTHDPRPPCPECIGHVTVRYLEHEAAQDVLKQDVPRV